jgi:hypothetical protein
MSLPSLSLPCPLPPAPQNPQPCYGTINRAMAEAYDQRVAEQRERGVSPSNMVYPWDAVGRQQAEKAELAQRDATLREETAHDDPRLGSAMADAPWHRIDPQARGGAR